MTSAVFGGIAANSHGEATVTLEERIAVGDPGCRVVIQLGAVPDAGSARPTATRRTAGGSAQPVLEPKAETDRAQPTARSASSGRRRRGERATTAGAAAISPPMSL